MTQQLINVGLSPNDGTGDNLRQGAQKINANFTELYASLSNSVTNISSGEGIAISGSLGQYTITNSQPNRGAIHTINVEGQDSVVATSLQTALELVSGPNVTLTTDNETKKITLSVTSLAGPVTGNVTGNLAGNVTGNLTGNVIGNVTGNITGNVDSTRVHILGNASAAYAHYQALTAQQTALYDEIDALVASYETANGELLTAQGQLAYLQSQPDYPNKANDIAAVNATISTLEGQITGYSNQIADDQQLLDSVTYELSLLEPTLNTPYAVVTYDAVNLILNANRTITAPAIITDGIIRGDIKPIAPVIFPSYTTSARDALPNVQEGSVIFNTSSKKLQVYTGTSWDDLN